MPVIHSVKKSLRAAVRKRIFNLRRKEALKRAVKDVHKAVVAKREDVPTVLSAAYKAIDKAAKRGVIKKNTAARKKSRLAKATQKAA